MSDVKDKVAGAAGDEESNLPAPSGGNTVEAFNEHMLSLTADDGTDVSEKVLRAVLNATTAQDILRAGEALPADQLLGMPLRINAIRASESGYVDGADYYLHVDATIIANGDAVTFSCGASDVCMKLIRLDQLNLLPITAKLERATKATKAGFFPLFLRALDSDQEPF